jgi:magnesium-transporting ATPase (P-type)
MKISWMTILIYIIIIIAFWFALKVERSDTHCQDAKKTVCGEGYGRAYSLGIPEEGDDLQTLKNKIRITARYDVNSVHWRKTFIAAVISAFVILYILYSKIPSGIKFGTTIIVIYIIFYVSVLAFQKNIGHPALRQLDTILEKI